MAYICETDFVEENLLHNKDGDCLGELCAMLHDPQTEGDNFRREEEVDYLCIVGLIDWLAACRFDPLQCRCNQRKGYDGNAWNSSRADIVHGSGH